MDDEEDFLRGMVSLGVEPLDGRAVGREPPGEGLEDPGEKDRRLFEEAVRDLEAPPAKEASAPAAPAAGVRPAVRRVKARGKGERVDETIDLHGLMAEEALRRLERFVARAAAAGAKTVLVVTGKGHHSPGGRGVLKQRVEDWILAHGRHHVRAYADAPRVLGGRGACLLYLRQR